MGGRDRSGVDARGSIGDTKIGGDSLVFPEGGVFSKHRLWIVPHKVVGLGLLVIVAGCVIWLWPILDFYVIDEIRFLDTGPQVIAVGGILIALAVFAKLVLNPIINLIIR